MSRKKISCINFPASVSCSRRRRRLKRVFHRPSWREYPSVTSLPGTRFYSTSNLHSSAVNIIIFALGPLTLYLNNALGPTVNTNNNFANCIFCLPIRLFHIGIKSQVYHTVCDIKPLFAQRIIRHECSQRVAQSRYYHYIIECSSAAVQFLRNTQWVQQTPVVHHTKVRTNTALTC